MKTSRHYIAATTTHLKGYGIAMKRVLKLGGKVEGWS
jgi:hypothetical protein